MAYLENYMLYLIYAESANYAGYGLHFVVEAPNADAAHEIASPAVSDYFYEQDYDQLLEEYGEDADDMFYGSILSTEVFSPEHESWKYYIDPTQVDFYQKVNF